MRILPRLSASIGRHAPRSSRGVPAAAHLMQLMRGVVLAGAVRARSMHGQIAQPHTHMFSKDSDFDGTMKIHARFGCQCHVLA
jgi:hypothetical protein